MSQNLHGSVNFCLFLTVLFIFIMILIKKKLHNNLIADFVIRFNNALKKNAQFVYVPCSTLLLSIVRLFYLNGCISSFSIERDLAKGGIFIKIYPRFTTSGAVIKSIKLVSSPGLRVFWSSSQLSKNFSKKNFQGFYVLSTNSGVRLSSTLFSSLPFNSLISGEVLLSVHL